MQDRYYHSQIPYTNLKLKDIEYIRNGFGIMPFASITTRPMPIATANTIMTTMRLFN